MTLCGVKCVHACEYMYIYMYSVRVHVQYCKCKSTRPIWDGCGNLADLRPIWDGCGSVADLIFNVVKGVSDKLYDNASLKGDINVSPSPPP